MLGVWRRWKRKMETKQYEIMMKKLSDLTVLELEKDMMEIEMLVRDMVIVALRYSS